MVFSDQTYSVLVVSAAQKFNEAFAEMLPGSEYYPVRFVGNIAAARREMVNKTYDLVIINAPLPDDFGTRFAIDACNQSGTVALLLILIILLLLVEGDNMDLVITLGLLLLLGLD